MSEYKEKIVNALTGEEIWRDYTTEEIAAVETQKLKDDAFFQEITKAAAEAAAAKAALLEKLGITEEEAKLLLS